MPQQPELSALERRREVLRQIPLEREEAPKASREAELRAEEPAAEPKRSIKERLTGRGAKFVFKALGALAAAGALAAFVMNEPIFTGGFALKRLEMVGDTQKVPLSRLKDAVEASAAGKNFFTVDLAAVQEAAQTVPWVKFASVRRVWPDAIVIDVSVFTAAAVYEDGRLVSTDGQLFAANPEEGSETVGIPSFSGSPEAMPEMLRRYRRFSALAERIPAKITDIALSDRGSWSLTIVSDEIPPTKIELGRELSGPAVEERLRLVVESYPRIVELLGGPPSSLDARYRRAVAAGKVDRAEVEAHRAAVAQSKLETTGAPAALGAPEAAGPAQEDESSQGSGEASGSEGRDEGDEGDEGPNPDDDAADAALGAGAVQGGRAAAQ